MAEGDAGARTKLKSADRPRDAAAAKALVARWRRDQPRRIDLLVRSLSLVRKIHSRYLEVWEYEAQVNAVYALGPALGAASERLPKRGDFAVSDADPAWAETILGVGARPEAQQYLHDRLDGGLPFILGLREARTPTGIAAFIVEHAVALSGERRPTYTELIVLAAATELEQLPQPDRAKTFDEVWADRVGSWAQRFMELRRAGEEPGQEDKADVIDVYESLKTATKRLGLRYKPPARREKTKTKKKPGAGSK